MRICGLNGFAIAEKMVYGNFIRNMVMWCVLPGAGTKTVHSIRTSAIRRR